MLLQRNGTPYLVPTAGFDTCIQVLQSEGALVRIRAPYGSGKTLLLNTLLDRRREAGDRVVRLDLKLADEASLADPDRFLRSLCSYTSSAIKQVAAIDQFWDEDIGSKLNASLYFESYIFDEGLATNERLILAIDSLDLLFRFEATAKSVLTLLRSWNEEAHRSSEWHRLGIIVAYSTECYVELNLQQSPFNIGTAIALEPFDRDVVLALTKHYGLGWSLAAADRLVLALGGNPALCHRAIADRGVMGVEAPLPDEIDRKLRRAIDDDSFYRDRFVQLWRAFFNDPDLFSNLRRLLEADSSIEVESRIAYQLESLGIVDRDRCCIQIRGELYRWYFNRQIAERWPNSMPTINPKLQLQFDRERLAQLEAENADLRRLVQRDPLTGLYNRRVFDQWLVRAWQEAISQRQALAIIFCDLDNFKFYNDTCGHIAGDQCLQRVSAILLALKEEFCDCIARYDGEEFVILRMGADLTEAIALAERIRLEIEALRISLSGDRELFGLPSQFVTISLGVAVSKPERQRSPKLLVDAADQALYRAKNSGRNCVCWEEESSEGGVWPGES